MLWDLYTPSVGAPMPTKSKDTAPYKEFAMYDHRNTECFKVLVEPAPSSTAFKPNYTVYVRYDSCKTLRDIKSMIWDSGVIQGHLEDVGRDSYGFAPSRPGDTCRVLFYDETETLEDVVDDLRIMGNMLKFLSRK